MTTGNTATPSNAPPPRPGLLRRLLPGLRVLFSLLLGGLGLWYLVRDTSPAEIRAALAQTYLIYILLALVVIILTSLAKAWRWQILYYPRHTAPPYANLFWTLQLSQLINTAVPFLRMGEIVRIIYIDRQVRVGKARTLGTLVVEKTLELLILMLLMVVLVPFVVVPDFVRDSGLVMALLALIAFAALALVAYQTAFIIRLLQRVAGRLPAGFTHRLLPLLISGLEGLAALRRRRTAAGLVAISTLIGLLYILTPFFLFKALQINLGLAEATAIHAVLSVGTVPAWAPANVGVFEFLVAFMLRYFDVTNPSLILTYTIIYHLVVILPQIILGGFALIRGDSRAATREALHRQRHPAGTTTPLPEPRLLEPQVVDTPFSDAG